MTVPKKTPKCKLITSVLIKFKCFMDSLVLLKNISMFFLCYYDVQEVKKRLSAEAAAAANRDGRWRNQMRRAAHNGCCRRVAQVRALSSVLWKLVISEELVGALTKIENPLVSCF